MEKVVLPPIPAKRYFTIGEVSELCGVKPHVLRYWEQEFSQLKPIKRSGNRRYYQHHEVLLIRRIRDLLYEQGFTINGARNRLESGGGGVRRRAAPGVVHPEDGVDGHLDGAAHIDGNGEAHDGAVVGPRDALRTLRDELESIRAFLTAKPTGEEGA
jgi:DNA-binding transcriptional MerR regulator